MAQACVNLGYKLLLIGRISDNNYIRDVKAIGSVEFRENITDKEVKKGYHNCAVHLCNSIDNFESGTLPILESMACGTPVLTSLRRSHPLWQRFLPVLRAVSVPRLTHSLKINIFCL